MSRSQTSAIGALERILRKYDDGKPHLKDRKSNALSDLQELLDDSSSVVSQSTIDILESIYDYIHSNFTDNTDSSNSEIDTVELMSTLQDIVRPKRKLSQRPAGSSSLPPRLRNKKKGRLDIDELISLSSSDSARDTYGSKSSKTKQKSNLCFENDLDKLLNKYDNTKENGRDSKLRKQEKLERSLKTQIASVMAKKSKMNDIYEQHRSNSSERQKKKKYTSDTTIGSKVSLEKAIKKLIKKKIAEKTGIEMKKENSDAAARTLEKKVKELTAMLDKEKDMLDELDEFGKVLESKMVQHERIQLTTRVEKLEMLLNEQQRRKKQKLGELSDLISKSHTDVDNGEYEQPLASMNSTIETDFDYHGMKQHHFENLNSFDERGPNLDAQKQLPDNHNFNHFRRPPQSPQVRRQYSQSPRVRRPNRQETRFNDYDQRIPSENLHQQPMDQYCRNLDEYDDDNRSYYEPQSRMQSTAGGETYFTKVGFDYGQDGTSEYTPRGYSHKHKPLRPALRSFDQRSYGGRGGSKMSNSVRSIPPVQFRPRNVKASPEETTYTEYYEDRTQYTESLPPPSQKQYSIQEPPTPQYQHSMENSYMTPLTEAMEKKIYDKVVSSIFSNEVARRALANDKKRNVRDDAEIIALAAISSLKAGRPEEEVKDIIADLLETYIDQRKMNDTDFKENRNILNIMNDGHKGERSTLSGSSGSHRKSSSRSAKSGESSRSDSSIVNLKWANMSVAAAATVLQIDGNEHVAKEAASAVLQFYKKEGRYMDANLAVGLAAANASTAVLSAGGERPSAAAVSVAVLKSASIKNSSKLLRKLASLNLIVHEDDNNDYEENSKNRNYENHSRKNKKSAMSLSEKIGKSKQRQNIIRVTPSVDGTSLEVSLAGNHNYDDDYGFLNEDVLDHYKSRSSLSKKSRDRQKQNYGNHSSTSMQQQETSFQNSHLPLKNYQRSGLPPRYPSSADIETPNDEANHYSNNSKGSSSNSSDMQNALKLLHKERKKKVSKRVTQIMEGFDAKQNPNVAHVKNGLFGNFFKRLRRKRISI